MNLTFFLAELTYVLLLNKITMDDSPFLSLRNRNVSRHSASAANSSWHTLSNSDNIMDRDVPRSFSGPVLSTPYQNDVNRSRAGLQWFSAAPRDYSLNRGSWLSDN